MTRFLTLFLCASVAQASASRVRPAELPSAPDRPAGANVVKANGTLPQSTLSGPKNPQSTLQCPCGAGGTCTCVDGCGCEQCKCETCPGNAAGVVKDAADAYRSQIQYGCPAVAFVSVPVRSVPGAVSYAVHGATLEDDRARVKVYTPTDWEELSPTATDADVAAAVKRLARPVVQYAPAWTVPVLFQGFAPVMRGGCST
jgi:hypothetical protein